jgi:ABC-type xylose transport system substrate-binding protein
VLLPDTQSSVRWETQDRRYLDQAFKAAGIDHTIVNAQGDPSTQRSQADQALTNGVKVSCSSTSTRVPARRSSTPRTRAGPRSSTTTA